MKRITSIFAAAAIAMLSGTAMADAQINFGDVWLGVNDEGHLNAPDLLGITTNAGATGLTFDSNGSGTGEDATSPGCLCEGWGVAVNGSSSMYATVDNDFPGISNITLDSFASTADTATSVVSMTSMAGLTVTHAYAPSAAGGVFEAVVTIANNTGAAMTDVLYTRAMDWDIFPDEFNEFVTIVGTGTTTDLEYSSDNGFSTLDPLSPFAGGDLNSCGETVDFTDCGPDDHGAYFRFNFGDLADGEEISFSIFYGAAGDEAGALAALGTIDAELYSLGQFSGDPAGGTPGTYLFAFAGVGGTPVVTVPEPSTLMLLGMGLMGLGLARRRRKA